MSAVPLHTDGPNRLVVPTTMRRRSLSCSSPSSASAVPEFSCVSQLPTNPSHDQVPLTPPTSRRTSLATTPNLKTNSLTRGQNEGLESAQTPTSQARPRAHSRCHQRSRSACLFPDDTADLKLPGYARPTERSRWRSRAPSIPEPNLENYDGASSDNKSQSTVTRHETRGDRATASIFKVTTKGMSPNILKIDCDSGFRLEVRILSANGIEVAAVPIQVDPVPSSPLVEFTPPCSPAVKSLMDRDMSTADIATIPALNISAPVELGDTSPSTVGKTLAEDSQPKQIIPTPPPPQTAEEHLEAVTAFVEERNISTFFQKETEDADGLLEKLSEKAAVLVKELGEAKVDAVGDSSFITDAATVAKVVKLSLYDQVIFCDDSYSMRMYGHLEPLKATLKSVAKIAIALNEPSDQSGGISLRFINYKKDSHMNNLSSVSEIENAVSEVPFDGDTKLGKQLKRKVLEPFLVDRLERQRRKLNKPILITIITDGEPQGENRDELKQTILWCKQYMENMGYGPWAVGFHIAQVGNSSEALAFLREIQDDPEVRGHVYVSREVAEISTDTSGSKGERENDLRWLTSLVRAIEH